MSTRAHWRWLRRRFSRAAARAEMSEIKVAQQYGISYLPLMLMEEQKLIEKHAKAGGRSMSRSGGPSSPAATS